MTDQSTLTECPACKRMVESRVHCKHCNAHMEPDLWYKNKPAPAPGAACKDSVQVHALPESVESALGVVALSDFPSVESVLRHHVSDLTRRLAGAEAERDECRHELVTLRHTLDDLVAHQRTRDEAAEARVRELEKIQELAQDVLGATIGGYDQQSANLSKHQLHILQKLATALAATEVKP